MKPEDVVRISSNCKDPQAPFELHHSFPDLFTSDDLAVMANWDATLTFMKDEYQSKSRHGKLIKKTIDKDKKIQNIVLIHEIHNE